MMGEDGRRPVIPRAIPLQISVAVFPLGFLVCVLFFAGCGGSRISTVGPGQNFPPYAGASTTLFDDQIDPLAVGLADVATNPRTDAKLRARAQAAEIVTRARVATVSVDTATGKPVYRLTLSFLDSPIVSRGFSESSVDISIRSDAPAFGAVKWLDSKLIGRTFVGFFQRFSADGEVELKFHLSADDPKILAAVRDAATVAEISRR